MTVFVSATPVGAIWSQAISTVSNIPELPIDFQEHHWNGLIDHATVYEDETIEFTFKSGAVISREI